MIINLNLITIITVQAIQRSNPHARFLILTDITDCYLRQTVLHSQSIKLILLSVNRRYPKEEQYLNQ